MQTPGPRRLGVGRVSEPWETEPDSKEWEAHGFRCEILRHSERKHLCGYVEIPPGHPCHGLSDGHNAHPRLPHLDVHGGIGWANWTKAPYTSWRGGSWYKDDKMRPRWLGRTVARIRILGYRLRCAYLRRMVHRRDPWRIGFDCAHIWDLVPASVREYAERGWGYPDGIYRDMAYVTRETEHLAEQLAAIAKARDPHAL